MWGNVCGLTTASGLHESRHRVPASDRLTTLAASRLRALFRPVLHRVFCRAQGLGKLAQDAQWQGDALQPCYRALGPAMTGRDPEHGNRHATQICSAEICSISVAGCLIRRHVSFTVRRWRQGGAWRRRGRPGWSR
jgi:hypothetical protein